MLHILDPLRRLEEAVPGWKSDLDSAAMLGRLFDGADSLVDAFRQQFEAQFSDRMTTGAAWELDELWAWGPDIQHSHSWSALESLFPSANQFLWIRNGLNARVRFTQAWGVVTDYSFERGAIYYVADPEIERIAGRNHTTGRVSTYWGWALPRAPYEIISRWSSPTTAEQAMGACFSLVVATTLEHPEWDDRVIFDHNEEMLDALDQVIGTTAENWASAFSSLASFRDWFTIRHIAEGMAVREDLERTIAFLQKIASGEAIPATEEELWTVKTAYRLLLEAAFLSGPITDY